MFSLLLHKPIWLWFCRTHSTMTSLLTHFIFWDRYIWVSPIICYWVLTPDILRSGPFFRTLSESPSISTLSLWLCFLQIQMLMILRRAWRVSQNMRPTATWSRTFKWIRFELISSRLIHTPLLRQPKSLLFKSSSSLAQLSHIWLKIPNSPLSWTLLSLWCQNHTFAQELLIRLGLCFIFRPKMRHSSSLPTLWWTLCSGKSLCCWNRLRTSKSRMHFLVHSWYPILLAQIDSRPILPVLIIALCERRLLSDLSRCTLLELQFLIQPWILSLSQWT